MQKMLHILVLGVFLLSGGAVSAQGLSEDELNMQRMQDRINSLEKNLITVQQELYKNKNSNNKSKGKAAPVSDEPIGSDEEKTRALNGKLEELQHNIDVLATKLDKIISDIDFRISALEKKVNEAQAAAPAADAIANKPVDTAQAAPAATDATPAPAAAVTPAEKPAENAAPAAAVAATVAPAAATPTPVKKLAPVKTTAAPAIAKSEANAQYDKAFEFIRLSKYDEAEKAFKDFIATNKNPDLQGNAYYWLGETYYSRQNYQQGAVNFLKSYQDYPKGSKAADSLFKLAMSLKNLKKEKEACATIDKMKKEYPKADKALLTSADAEKKGLKCK